MSRAARTSPNTFTIASDDGTVIRTLTMSVAGFIAWSAAGRSLGGYATMEAAMTALESAARQ